MDQQKLCYKDFTYRVRKHAYTSEAYIYLFRATPKLLQIVRLLSEVKFEHGSYHTYYGEVKRIMNGFLAFYYVAMDDIAKDADRLNNLATSEDMIELMEKTKEIHIANLDDFRKDYIPTNPEEQEKLEEIEELYIQFKNKVLKLQESVMKIRKPEDAQEFAKRHFEMSLQVPRGLCEMAFTYLSLMLAEDMDKTRISLLEILIRLKTNLKILNENSQKEKYNLREMLYDKNKIQIACRSKYNADTLKLAEAEAEAETIKIRFGKKSVAKKYGTPLEKEVGFWSQKLNDYYKVAENLILIKKEMAKLDLHYSLHNEMKSLPGSKKTCCETIENTFTKRKAYLEEEWEKAGRALLTFYACRGLDRIFYADGIGKYYLDEYNHQVYVMDYGLIDYHLTCAHHLITPPDEKYYFDKYGRFVVQDGKKLYQLAPCSSLYKIGPDGLLHKPRDPKELGMSEAEFIDKQCRRKVKDPNDVTLLPQLDPVDIKGTLDKDNAKYLWETFGSILPYALHDVAMSKSKNPIHFVAHRLLYHKCNATNKEQRDRKAEAEAFKANVYKERQEKLLSASKAWKSKQVKRRKPEESDDAQERAVYDAQMAQREFINSLNAL